MLPKAKNGRLDGAILVFLQGLKEIQTAHELISAQRPTEFVRKFQMKIELFYGIP